MIWPEITAETPIEEVKKIHQMIWDCTIKYGVKPETPYANNCAACQYVCKIYGCGCRNCAIRWPRGVTCMCEESLYSRWFNSKHAIIRKYFARKIRDIPWKFEKEYNQNV